VTAELSASEASAQVTSAGKTPGRRLRTTCALRRKAAPGPTRANSTSGSASDPRISRRAMTSAATAATAPIAVAAIQKAGGRAEVVVDIALGQQRPGDERGERNRRGEHCEDPQRQPEREAQHRRGPAGRVHEATAEELAELDIGGWFDPGFASERVATLDAVLEAAKGRPGVLIELKYDGHPAALSSGSRTPCRAPA
jgi:hypothetical protein